MRDQKAFDDHIVMKVKDGGPMPESRMRGSRQWVKKILCMTNDDIMAENQKIVLRISGLSVRERKFCAQMALFIVDYNLKNGRIKK